MIEYGTRGTRAPAKDYVINADINTLIKNVFGKNNKVNIIYADTMSLSPGTYGYAPPPSGLDANGNLNIVVNLNKNSLANFSQEFIATVIMHESMHAYLTTMNIFGDLQHETIATTYVTAIAASLQQMFTGLSDIDAKNLSLGGLQATQNFKNTISNDMVLDGQFDATQLAYQLDPKGKDVDLNKNLVH